MRRLLAWLGGVLGGIAAYRFVRSRHVPGHEVAPAVPAGEADPRAEALRAKLDEARAGDETVAAEPDAEAVPERAPAEGPVDPEARRRSVHEHGRAALEEMRAGERES